MRILTALVDFLFLAAYFILADHVGPKLVMAGKSWLWWLILFALVSGSYLFTRWIPSVRRTRANRSRALVIVAYTLMLITLFLYDFSLRPLLDKFGIGNAWIVFLMLTFMAVAVGTRKSCREDRGSSE